MASSLRKLFTSGHVNLLALSRAHRVALSSVGRRTVSVCAVQLTEEKVTHTGQHWDQDDYRQVRFVDREKMVNQQFAIDLLSEEPVVLVEGTHTWCDGGRGALGHPKVFINLDKPEINDCGYCGKKFLANKYQDQFQKHNTVKQE